MQYNYWLSAKYMVSYKMAVYNHFWNTRKKEQKWRKKTCIFLQENLLHFHQNRGFKPIYSDRLLYQQSIANQNSRPKRHHPDCEIFGEIITRN